MVWKTNLKDLKKQLDQANVKNIIKDKSKNIIKDNKVSNFTFRYQTIKNLPSKELRTIVDAGKKDIKKGVLIVFSILDGKVGVSVGVTKDLIEKFDAVELVKVASSILGGKGGGGRKDFAQAGGDNENKILIKSSSPKSDRFNFAPKLLSAKHISRSVVIKPPEATSCPASI